ncbi:MAG: nitroreductase family protein [Desulfobacterales bacterium]|jgi:nitroreductase|nr:nitroreductase family protein [Desulfobacterales bacterium]
MFIDLIRSRRSIRKFQDRPVEPEKIDSLVETVLRAPSSRDLNPWSFVVVTDPDMISALSKAKPHGASFLSGAPLAIVVCADPAKSDVWVEDASIAAIYLHLAATDLALGSCWIQLRERMHDAHQSAGDYVSGVLGLPEGMAVEAIIAIGYSAEKKTPHSKSGLPHEKVSWERYGHQR